MKKKTTKAKDGKGGDYQRLVEQETLIFEATELLSELIEEGKLSRKELAEKMGRSKGFVTQILAGDRNMTLRTLADFSYALDHRVKVKAAPLVESGDGGEGVGTEDRAIARVRAGAGVFIAGSDQREAIDDPRRPLAAEGAGMLLRCAYSPADHFTSLAMGGSEELILETWHPKEAPEEIETVAA
jgi:transcriptional regulator with XRE-family HTH domain